MIAPLSLRRFFTFAPQLAKSNSTEPELLLLLAKSVISLPLEVASAHFSGSVVAAGFALTRRMFLFLRKIVIIVGHRAFSLCPHVMTLRHERLFTEQLVIFLHPRCEFSVVCYSEGPCCSTRKACSHAKATPCCRHRKPFSSLPAKAARDLARSIRDHGFLITDIMT